MISFKEDAIKQPSNQNNDPEIAEDKISGFLWKTFVGNKKKEDFLKSSFFLLILINGLLAFFLYNQKTQKSVYVIDAGVPKIATLVESGTRVDEQVVFFIKVWMKLLVEINGDNYKENRDLLKDLSTQDLMRRILTAESSSSNRLLKELIQSETMRLKIVDIVIDKIERRGSLITVAFNEIIQIDVPSGNEKYVTPHQAELITTSYNLNGIGLAMVNIDNLWKLDRSIE
ncbi:MAG: hypothetical protein ACE5IR_05470 [bacterium]